jgi:hypothetical protein
LGRVFWRFGRGNTRGIRGSLGSGLWGGSGGLGGRLGWVRFGRRNRLRLNSLRVKHGFGVEFRTELLQAVEILHGAAVEALGLGLVAEQEGESQGLAREHGAETAGEPVIVVLAYGELQAVGEIGLAEDEGLAIAVQGLFEAVGEEAGFHEGDAKHTVLGQGDAFDGEHFLGVDGLIEVDGVGAEVGYGCGVFGADHGIIAGVEGEFAAVLGGASFAFGGAGAGGTGGIGAIGGEALRGDMGVFIDSSFSMRAGGG